jgi:Domain of unknown function (DUF1887)
MTKFDTHLCLVSAQATPNLIPVMDQTSAPHRVVLAVSTGMKQRAEWLLAVMRRHGVQVEILHVPDAYDFNGCWEIFSDWLTAQQCSVALNVTGGTKVMAMAAQDVFREMKLPVFYINVENDSLLRLDRGEQPFILPTKIKLREYLESHGYTVDGEVKRPNISAEQRDLVGKLAYESERLGGAFGRLNYLAKQAEVSLATPMLDAKDRDSRSLDELIGMFEQSGWLSIRDHQLHFENEAARQFVNGGWLEDLVYQSLAQLSPEFGFADYAIDLTVLAPDGKTRNQLDAAFLHRNTLHMIECKSANLALSGKVDKSAGTEALYKLDGLRDMGGLRSKALLIDYRGGLSDADKRRAEQMKLRIISGSQLRDLTGALRAWLEPKKII